MYIVRTYFYSRTYRTIEIEDRRVFLFSLILDTNSSNSTSIYVIKYIEIEEIPI